MRRVILLFASTLALVLAAPASSATVTVSIKRTGFTPKTVNINQDDAVTWTNNDTINHQIVANNGTYASPILGPGKSWTHAFHNGGTFRYHDSLHPSLTGSVVVKGAPPQVSLVASAPVVKYGATVTLSGTVSNKKAGETVTLVQLPFGQTTKQVVATLQTTTGGAFSYTVTPQVNTTYQAQWPGKSESSVTVQVQPMIKLPFVSKSGYFHFYVTAGTSEDVGEHPRPDARLEVRAADLGAVRALADPARPLVDPRLHAGDRDGRRLSRQLERDAAGRQTLTHAGELRLPRHPYLTWSNLCWTASQLTTFHHASR